MSKLIVNCETGEAVERELNKAEKDQQKIDEVLSAKLQAEQAEIDAKRKAITDRLGLTVDEAKLLLG
jgi:prefoldin subunit 5